MNPTNPNRFAASFILVALGAALSFALAVQSQSDEVDARGVFLKSRKPTPTPTPKPKITDVTKRTEHKPPKRPAPLDPKPEQVYPAPADEGLNRIGLGYSLYKLDDKRKAVRANPSEAFQTGNSVQFVIEPNIDGFLYIFHAVNDDEPKMLFPDHRLSKGENRIEAHVPYEVPSAASGRWFKFRGDPAMEHLYFIVTRKPLDEIPSGAKLVEFCRLAGNTCPWKPATTRFDQLLANAGKSSVAKSLDGVGEPQDEKERDAIVGRRDLALGDPQPSVIVLNDSKQSDVLVMKTHLKHVKP